MMRRYAIAVIREAGEFWAFVPDVPGVYGQGATPDDACGDVKEALEDYLAFVREKGEPVPPVSSDSVEVRYAEISV